MFSLPGSVHFIGICGTAMASTAAALQQRGVSVTGSDANAYPPMSTFLEAHGIEVREGYHPGHLPPNPGLVVIGNAMSRGNPEVEAVLARRLPYTSLPELLREGFIRGRRSLVVAGTHGKTTTAALLAWTLEHSGRNPSFLIGGIPENFGCGARFTDSEWFVIEGDEYDTAFFDKRSKFVHYLPEVAVINNLEFDHADIFENLAAVQNSFRQLVNLIPPNGLLLANGDDPRLAPLLKMEHCPIQLFGIGAKNHYCAEFLQREDQGTSFVHDEHRFHLPMIGEHNVRNALAVLACARYCGLTNPEIQSAWNAFQGIKRRLEVRGTERGVTVIDDFGHHPTAIRETLRALRSRYAGRRLWALFEPRSNTTRRRVLQGELTKALALADHVVLANVARLHLLSESERLDPHGVVHELNLAGTPAHYLPDVPHIIPHVCQLAKPGDIVCVFSNGGFDGIHAKLLAALAEAPFP